MTKHGFHTAVLAGGRGGSDGLWAPPGKYTVALTVSGRRLVRPLEVTGDPRLKVTAVAYGEQFALSRSIEKQRVRIAAALAEANKLTDTLAERRTKAGATAPALIDSLQNEINDLTGADPASAESWWLPPKTTTSLKFLQGALEKLASAVAADAAPTADAQASIALLQPQVDTAINRWISFRGENLSTANKKLDAAGEAPIPMP